MKPRKSTTVSSFCVRYFKNYSFGSLLLPSYKFVFKQAAIQFAIIKFNLPIGAQTYFFCQVRIAGKYISADSPGILFS